MLPVISVVVVVVYGLCLLEQQKFVFNCGVQEQVLAVPVAAVVDLLREQMEHMPQLLWMLCQAVSIRYAQDVHTVINNIARSVVMLVVARVLLLDMV
jgi:hypothetical protein